MQTFDTVLVLLLAQKCDDLLLLRGVVPVLRSQHTTTAFLVVEKDVCHVGITRPVLTFLRGDSHLLGGAPTELLDG